MANLKITQIKSTIGRGEKQQLVMKGLGLKKIRHCVVRPDTDSVRGMLFLVSHLVRVENTDEPATATQHPKRKTTESQEG